MTQDEIIEMAILEAEFVSRGKPSEEESELFVCLDKDIVRFAKLVAAKEREACAKVCESIYTNGDGAECWLENAASKIRARSGGK